ncbi:oligosaccharide flippase family protein [Arenibaculum pallidiluteum]|uniref:oligosaccharide flippase family protein n=1 Tax=Arenibaculum pallidiluteum TaxID=2812559 RepID=UPI001A966C1C|nr:oligosaccharide flippase family protein [Arenibaculum pallidiluteum]
MAGVRRAFVLNAAERYSVIAVQFTMIAAVSRLLTPAEIGLSVVGSGIMTVALSLREFVTSEFLVQRRDISREDVRTSFTVLFAVSATVAAALAATTPWIADFYGEPGLARYLRVTTAACVVETLALPITALLRRDMAFGALAVINAASAVAGAAVTLILAILGFSYMSFAWALLAASATSSLLAFAFRPEAWILRPSLASWRGALAFGCFNGSTIILTRIYDSLPQLVLGRFLPLSTVALYNRASMVCGLPDRFILSGVFSVAYPAFAAEVRRGGDLKRPYLDALSYITVLHWPALLVLALLAHPAVLLILGGQWLGTAPLIQIMAVASLSWFPVILTYPVLVSLGALRDNFASKLLSVALAAPILCLASAFGVTAMAASLFLTLPIQMLVSLSFVRRHVPFAWWEIPAAVGRSAVVTLCSVLGPAAVLVLSGGGGELSAGATTAASLLAIAGWAAGLAATRHPFLKEIRRTLEAVGGQAVLLRLARVRFRPFGRPRPAGTGETS